jgi:cell division transport system permease protein
MQSIKSHLSLILALVTILFTLQVYLVAERTISDYEQQLTKNYSMILIAQKPLDKKTILNKFSTIKDLEAISQNKVLEKFKNDLSKTNLGILKASMPKFYRIYLKRYPTPTLLSQLKKGLEKTPYITKVENFSNAHNQIYNILLIFKTVLTIFALGASLVSLLLMTKQMRIWQFEHQERMEIMALFGAPTLLRSGVLFRVAFIDALLSTLIVIILFMVLNNNTLVETFYQSIGMPVHAFELFSDGFVLLQTSLVLSLALATIVVLKHKDDAR